MPVQKKWFIVLGLIAVAGHLLGIAADLYSGFVPSVNVSLGPITSLSLDNIAPLFEAKSLAQARIGHYLAIFFIPLGILGIWQIFLGLDPAGNNQAFAFLVLGTLGIVYATFYHGTLAFIIGALQHQSLNMSGSSAESSADLVVYFNSLSEPLGLVLLIADFLVSGIFAAIVLYRETFFPKWMAAFNPVTIQLTLSLLILVVPHPLSQLVWLTVFNTSLAIWYSGVTVALSRSAS